MYNEGVCFLDSFRGYHKRNSLTGFRGFSAQPLQSGILRKDHDFPQDSAIKLGGYALEKPTHPFTTYPILELTVIHLQLDEMPLQSTIFKKHIF